MSKAYGTPTSSQLEKINLLAKRALNTEDVFVFTNKAIGDGLIPTRMMRVHKSLLGVFKEDAKKGVSLMIDHPWAHFVQPKPAYSYGRTFDANLKKTMDSSSTDETWALFVEHYMVRGREKDGIATDQLIADIEDGTMSDTSIGFTNNTYECSICNKSYFSCEHYRGQEYDGEVCTVNLKTPGNLFEDSLVFAGAYPGANILSSLSVEGIENTLDPVEDLKGFKEGTRFLHTFSDSRGAMNTFMLREPIKGIVVPEIKGLAATGAGGADAAKVGTTGTGTADTADATKAQTQTQTQGKEETNKLDLKEQVFAAVLAAAGIAQEDIDAMTADQIMAAFTSKTTESVKLTIQEGTQAATATLMFALTEPDIRRALGLTEAADQPVPENWSTKMVQFSQEGRDSRQELITDTLDWGVRAHGNDFAMESYREILSEPGRTVQAIKDMREQFKKKANEELAAGRATKIVTGKGNEKAQSQAHIPAEAYKI